MRRVSYRAGLGPARGLRLMAAALAATAFAIAGPGQGTAAPATGPGEACLFSAPHGAVPDGGLVGHIGWGFQNGTSDDWTFGATEGIAPVPYVPPGGNTDSWQESGTFAAMLNAFGTGDHPFSKGEFYYLQYRCTKVTSSNPSAALAEVQAKDATGYNLVNDNCLTKAVAILQAYNVAGLPNVPLFPPGDLPDTYFSSELPAFPGSNPGFNSVQYFTTLTVGVKVLDPLTNSYLNSNPVHQERPMRIRILDGSGNVLYDSGFSLTAKVTSGTDRYQTTVQLPSPSLLNPDLQAWSGPSAATYTMSVQLATTPGDLRGLTLPSAENISVKQAAANTVPDVQLTVGDINDDGYVNLEDYDLLVQCVSDIAPPKGPCDAGLKTAADIDDDGTVGIFDYNELIRVFSYLRKVNG